MDISRSKLLSLLIDRIGARKLVWVGTRGHDAVAFMELPQFLESYGLIAPLGAVSLDVDFTLEDISGLRVDLDTYKIDADWSAPAQELRRRLLTSLNEPTVIVAYRPFALLSALCYPRSDYVTYLGMFHERQATFEHKPWVESELGRIGVPTIPWRYFADEDVAQLEELVSASGPIVVRTNRSDGGAGLRVLSSRESALARNHRTADGFFAAAPYLSPNISLNISGCIFNNGEVTLHPPSVQLIGFEALTRWPFGYCGNDFSVVKGLDPEVITNLEMVTIQTARWLHSQGYLGAFGIDALVHEGQVLLAEVNPRFQGSSLLSARLDKSLGRPDVFLCHLAAYLDVTPPTRFPLKELVKSQSGYSQILLHNLKDEAVPAAGLNLEEEAWNLELIPRDGTIICPNATVLRAVTRGSLLMNGAALTRPIKPLLEKYSNQARLPILQGIFGNEVPKCL